MPNEDMSKFLLVITDELLEVIDHARGKHARNPWIEKQLRSCREIKKAAAELKIKFPERAVRPYEYADD